MENVAGQQSKNAFKFSEPLQIANCFPDIKRSDQNKQNVFTFSLPLDVLHPTSAYGTAHNDSSFTTLGKQFKRSPNEWECDVCMIRNNLELDKCVACETPRKSMIPLINGSFGQQFKKSLNKWECDTCLVQNTLDSKKCIACETPRNESEVTKPVTNADEGFKTIAAQQKASKWECSACMTQNDNNYNKCICCDQLKPGYTKVEPEAAISGAVKFAFGFGNGINAPTENELRKTEACHKEKYKVGFGECNFCKNSNKNEAKACLACHQSKKSVPQFKVGFANLNTTQADAGFTALASQQKVSKWECSVCMTLNDNIKSICACCEHTKIGTVISASTNNETKDENIVATTKFSFGFGPGAAAEEELRKGLLSKSAPIKDTSKEGHTKEETQIEFGITSNSTVDAGFKSLVAQQKLCKWECDACMTQNNDELLRCACCEQAKPGENFKTDLTKLSLSETVASKFRFGFGNGINAPTEEDLKKEMKTK